MNTQSKTWIAVLTLTAIILGAILLASPGREAQAAMINAQSGFTLMTTGAAGGAEYLVVIDQGPEKKMLLYKLNGNKLDVAAGANFGKFFQAR